MTPHDDPALVRRKSRAIVMAIALGAFVLLMYGISIVKMTMS